MSERTAASPRVPTPQVLKHRGVPITVHALGETAEGRATYERRFDGEGENASPVYEERWLQFTNSVLVDMENPAIGWADLEGWEDDLQKRPTVALVRTLALALEVWVPGKHTETGDPVPDLRRTGKMLLDGQTDEYATAVGAAFMLSQGISPERAGEALRAGVKNAAEVRPLIDAEVQKMLAKEQETMEEAFRALNVAADTPTSPSEPPPGTPGTPGSEPAETSTPSGG